MKINVNGQPITSVTQADGKLHIDVQIEGAGEDLPPTIINVTGGRLTVHVREVTRSGDILINYL